MNKVVPFERGSDYLARRAQVNRRAGRLLDALDLQRRAAERGGGASSRLDMAQILCQMGCYEESNRVLAGMALEPGASDDRYFGLCCNYAGMGEEEMAYRALIQFLSRNPRAVNRDEVSEMLQRLTRLRLEREGAQGGRRAARAARLAQAASRQDAQGNLAVCVRLRRRALGALDGWEDEGARASLAEALVHMGERGEAARQMDLAMRGEADNSVLCAAAKVYAACGQMDKARLAVERLAARSPQGPDLRLLLDACCAVGDDERVRLLAPKALREAPYDRKLLHQCAVNRVREGRPAEQAVSFWTRALRVDPGDMVARWALGQTAAGRLDKNMSYAYALPEAERTKWRRQIAQALLLDDASLAQRYAKSRALEERCRWALFSDDRGALLLARALLARLDDPAAARLLRESMASPAAAGDAAAQAAIHPDIHVTRVPPPIRRAMKDAIAAAREERGVMSQRIVRVMMNALGEGMRTLPGGPRPVAAALYHLAAKDEKDAPTLKKTARMFSCGARRVARCARLLERKENGHEAD